jgi:hypothetical protein
MSANNSNQIPHPIPMIQTSRTPILALRGTLTFTPNECMLLTKKNRWYITCAVAMVLCGLQAPQPDLYRITEGSRSQAQHDACLLDQHTPGDTEVVLHLARDPILRRWGRHDLCEGRQRVGLARHAWSRRVSVGACRWCSRAEDAWYARERVVG